MDEALTRAIESIKRRNPLKDPTTPAYKKTGRAASEVLAKEISAVFGRHPSIDIMDFGAATGRVAVPLAQLMPASRVVGVDVDADAVTYFRHVAPSNAMALISGYNPPLAEIEDNSFDVVFSLSVWSHFPEELGLKWLRELRRISRPNALVLISTGGAATLEVWKKQSPAWADLSAEDLNKYKFIYRGFNGVERAFDSFPGIAGEGSWGNAAIHPDYIRERWCEFFTVSEIRQAGFSGSQDLVIMRRQPS